MCSSGKNEFENQVLSTVKPLFGTFGLWGLKDSKQNGLFSTQVVFLKSYAVDKDLDGRNEPDCVEGEWVWIASSVNDNTTFSHFRHVKIPTEKIKIFSGMDRQWLIVVEKYGFEPQALSFLKAFNDTIGLSGFKHKQRSQWTVFQMDRRFRMKAVHWESQRKNYAECFE